MGRGYQVGEGHVLHEAVGVEEELVGGVVHQHVQVHPVGAGGGANDRSGPRIRSSPGTEGKWRVRCKYDLC